MRTRTILIASAMLVGLMIPVIGQDKKTEPSPKTKPYVYVPETASPEFQEHLRKLPNPALRPIAPAPDDMEGWKRYYETREKDLTPRAELALKKYEPTIAERKLGGIPVLDIKPKGWKESSKVLVYLHGGAYTLASARSSLPKSAFAADATGFRVIAVDYTVAPRAKWLQVTDEVVAVVQALVKEGHALKDIGMFGDSAGGGMTPGVVLKMRDQKLGMPAAVVLWSPWSDITETGDTYVTLKHAEPTYHYERILKQSADAYADPKDQKHPYVSPVYGDYTKGFPPTLIQGGTKEIFLSNFVRQYQAMDTAGQTVKLDLYEGMPHVFQGQLPDAPESKLAMKKMREFFLHHLGK
ncbi:MAG: alpha/beta hydrolase [Planctomycetes bacterium]|nr:alpha/beta hydrolase [Planctomycetota bacterium]